MFEVTAVGWVVLAVAAALIGLSKTALPGAGSLVVAMFAAVLPAKESTAAMLLLLIAGDVLAVWTYRHDADWKVLRGLVPSVVVGIVTGAVFLTTVNDTIMKRAIAVILLTLVALTLFLRTAWWQRRARERQEKGSSRVVQTGYGLLGGFTTMAANTGGPVMSLYFLYTRFDVVKFLGTSAWFFFVVNLIKVPFSAGIGLITSQTLLSTVILAPLVILGALAGKALARRMTNAIFDPIVLTLTVVSALALLF